MKSCPHCLEEIDEELTICPQCNEKLEGISEEPSKSSKKTFFKTKKFKIISISVISVGFLFGAIFLFRHFYTQHQQRFLKDARAYLELGDKKSAVPLFQKHLLMNPKDNQNKMIYASLLDEIGEKEKALEVFEVLLLSNIKDEQKKWIRRRIYYVYDDFIEKQSDLAEKAIIAEKYDEARECYKEMSNYIQLSIDKVGLSKELYTQSSDYKFGEYEYKSLLDKFEELKAKYAFSYWLEGNYNKAYEIAEYWLIPDFAYVYVPDEHWEYLKNQEWPQEDSCFAFAYLLFDKASEAFNKKNWTVAIEAYKNASEYFEKGRTKALGFASDCLYSCAMAYWNSGSHYNARQTLNTLKKKYPDYEAKEVNQLIKESHMISTWNIGKKNWDEASSYFKKKDWISARVYLIKAMEYYKKAGEPDSSNLIGEIRLNICYTYYNEHSYQKAKEILLEIQKKNPDYEPMLVKETLEKVEELLKIYRE